MKTARIEDVTQEEFDSAVQTIVSAVKANDPKLDTRVGTVLRSLLVNPEARIDATTRKQIEYVRSSTSLKSMKDAGDAGEQVDVDDVNAVMSNFNIRSGTGTFADGIVKIDVIDGSQSYTVAEGTEFSTFDGLKFVATSTVTAVAVGSKIAVASNSVLYKGAAGFFLLVPVRASAVGSAFNIIKGTGLRMNSSLYTFVSAEAYKTFNGGSDISDIQETIAKIPAGLSIRGFVNKRACEGMLRDEFDGGSHPIVACSTVGYGNRAQRRDKHNLFGVGVGGRIDLYVRNFHDLYTISKQVTGTKGAVPGEYRLHLTAVDFPCGYWVKDVGCSESIAGSLEFSCRRTCSGVDRTWHDIDVRKNPSEAFNSIWQEFDVTLTKVPTLQDGSEPDTRGFNVTVFCLPQAKELQEYVDRDDVRSGATEVVVRCPVICNVSVNATVVYDTGNPIDVGDAKSRIRKYINGLGFVNALTRSEIVHILKGCGAVSVDLSKKDMLYGTLYDAFGREYNLSGDSLQLDGLAADDAMVTPDTAVFAVEPENIQLTIIPNY